MTYAIRNSIIIGTLLIIVLVATFIGKSRSKKELSIFTREFEQVDKKLSDLKKVNPDLEKEKEIMAQHDELQRKALQKTKFILQNDDASLAYDYLTDITNRYCSKLNFDFNYNGEGENQGVRYNEYSINGNTDIKNFFTFVYQIETQSPLFIIQSFEVRQETDLDEESKKKSEIIFNLSLYAYFDQNGVPYEELPFMNLKYKNITSNPFKPRIHDPKKDDEELLYVDIEKIKILGFTKNNIMIEETGGKVSFLSVGDKVAYGYLQKINWEEQFALFNINRIGIALEEKLYVNVDGVEFPTNKKINWKRK